MTEELHKQALEVDLDSIESAVLRRIIEEIRMDESEDDRALIESKEPRKGYNRTHNRHNRSTPGTVPYNRTHNRHNRGL